MKLRLAVLLALAPLALAACGGKSAQHSATSTSATTTDSDGCLGLTKVPDPQKRTAPKPTKRLDPSKTYDVTLHTNCGSFTIRLAVTTSPETTASFLSLARRGYFRDSIFHRIVPNFVIQGGDPTGQGDGGPGYSTVDPPPANTHYDVGVVAMAKTAAEKRGTAGSQFFVVTGKDAAQLPPDYAVLGKVVDGLDTALRIGKLGDPNTQQPLRLVVIQTVTVDVH